LSEGKVVVFGEEEDQRGTDLNLEDIIQISSGRWYNLALSIDGNVYSWFRNSEG